MSNAPMTMRAVGWSRAGSGEPPQVLALPVPVPGPGEIRVRVVASALNPADLKVSSGDFVGRLLHARTRPLVTGYDFSGVADAVGEGVRLKAGDLVYGFLPYSGSNRQGAFAEYVIAPEKQVALEPSGLSHQSAAALATSGATALQCLRDQAGIASGDHVLVIGAAGGVGSMAIGICKKLGAGVTGVCSSYAVDFVRELGADEVVDRRKQDPTELSGPFRIVFDAASAHGYFDFRTKLPKGGTYVATLPGPGLFAGKLFAPLFGHKVAFIAVKSTASDLERLATWAAGGMRVPIEVVYPVRELGRAIERLAKGELRGRLVIQVEGGF